MRLIRSFLVGILLRLQFGLLCLLLFHLLDSNETHSHGNRHGQQQPGNLYPYVPLTFRYGKSGEQGGSRYRNRFSLLLLELPNRVGVGCGNRGDENDTARTRLLTFAQFAGLAPTLCRPRVNGRVYRRKDLKRLLCFFFVVDSATAGGGSTTTSRTSVTGGFSLSEAEDTCAEFVCA